MAHACLLEIPNEKKIVIKKIELKIPLDGFKTHFKSLYSYEMFKVSTFVNIFHKIL